MHHSALEPCRGDAPPCLEGDALLRHQAHRAVRVHRDRVRLHRAGIANGAREHPGRTALGKKGTEVEGLVLGRLHFHPHSVEIQARERNRAPGREDQIPALGDDDTAVLDTRREQEDPARPGPHRAPVGDCPCVGPGIEAVVSVQKVRIADCQRGSDEAGGIDARVLAEHDAVGIDQKHPPVGQEPAENLRCFGTDDPVENRAPGSGLDEARQLIASNREPLPVDDRVRRSRDIERARDGTGEPGAAVDHGGPGRVAVRNARRAPRNETRQHPLERPAPDTPTVSLRRRVGKRSSHRHAFPLPSPAVTSDTIPPIGPCSGFAVSGPDHILICACRITQAPNAPPGPGRALHPARRAARHALSHRAPTRPCGARGGVGALPPGRARSGDRPKARLASSSCTGSGPGSI